jgi:hypothetical protein
LVVTILEFFKGFKRHREEKAKMKRQLSHCDDTETPTKYIKIDDSSTSSSCIELPNDCLLNMFMFCPTDITAFILPAVCKTWNTMTTNEETEECQLLWRQLCFKEWPILNSIYTGTTIVHWRAFFKNNARIVSPLYCSDVCNAVTLEAAQSQASLFDNIVRFIVMADKCKQAQTLLNSVEIYQSKQKQMQEKYNEMISQDNEEKEKTPVEILFLSWFNKVIKVRQDNKEQEHSTRYIEEVEYEIKGPSTNDVSVELCFEVDSGEYDDNDVANLKIYLLQTGSDYELYSNKNLSENFIEHLITIYACLGLREISILELWDYLVNVGRYVKSGSSYLRDMKRAGETKIKEFLKNHSVSPSSLRETALTHPEDIVGNYRPEFYQHDTQIMESIYAMIKNKNDKDVTLEVLDNAPSDGDDNTEAKQAWSPLIDLLPIDVLKDLTEIEEFLEAHNYLVPSVVQRLAKEDCTDLSIYLKLTNMHSDRKMFECIPLSVRNDPSFFTANVYMYPNSFCIAKNFDSDQRDNAELMLACLKHSDETLHYISDRLKSDRTFILEAAEHLNSLNIIFEILPDLRHDEEFLVQVGAKNTHDIILPDNISKEVAIEIAKHGTLKHLPQHFRSDKDVVLIAIIADPYAFRHASDEFKKDKEMIAKSESNSIFDYMAVELLLDKPFILDLKEAGRKNLFSNVHEVTKYFFLKLLRTYADEPEIVKEIKQKVRFENDQQIVLEEVRINLNRCHIPEHLEKDKCISEVIYVSNLMKQL